MKSPFCHAVLPAKLHDRMESSKASQNPVTGSLLALRKHVYDIGVHICTLDVLLKFRESFDLRSMNDLPKNMLVSKFEDKIDVEACYMFCVQGRVYDVGSAAGAFGLGSMVMKGYNEFLKAEEKAAKKREKKTSLAASSAESGSLGGKSLEGGASVAESGGAAVAAAAGPAVYKGLFAYVGFGNKYCFLRVFAERMMRECLTEVLEVVC